MIDKIKGLIKYTDCGMPTNIEDLQNRRMVRVYNEAIDDVVKLLLSEVNRTFKVKETITFFDWLQSKGYIVDDNFIFKGGKFYSIKTLESKYKREQNLKP